MLGLSLGIPSLSTMFGRKPLSALIAAMFASGEQGVWYDPSDLKTLFQDSAGTTPVTAVEQPVGLMLDKSKGLVLGSELIGTQVVSPYTGNGTVAEASGTYTATCTINGNYGISFGTLGAANKRYLMTFEVLTNSASKAMYGWASTGSSDNIAAGTTIGVKSGRILGGAGGTVIGILGGVAGESFSVRLVSLKELPGNHAYQVTSAARPVLSARVNLLTGTETAANASWLNAAASLSQSADPIGGNTAITITGDGTSGIHSTRQGTSVSGGRKLYFIAKAGTNNFLQIFTDGTSNEWANFNLSTGVVGSVGTETSGVSVQSYGSGWYICQVTFPNANATTHVRFALVTSATSARGESNTLNTTVQIWHPDYRNSNDGVGIPAYQRVNTSTDYDTTGFPLYIKPNGSSQFMVTNSINFTGTDKMTVWAGVRKLSDAALGVVCELGTGSQSNNVSLWNGDPVSTGAGAKYTFISGGTAGQGAVTGASYASPTTNVLTGLGNIPGNQDVLRVNGTQAASNTAAQGTGTYGNYQMYLFARNGASFWLNGRFYGLIVRGAASSAQQIADAETYLNSKTKAF